MPATLMLILCLFFVFVLLRIERKQNLFASYTLWIPTLWVLIVGSRPIGRWFEHDQNFESIDYTAGSLIDRSVLNILMFLALVILIKRRIEWSRILKENIWLIVLFFYMGLSILWSDFPFVSLKRCIKVAGAFLMALVVLSEDKPFQALESVFRRIAYILIPFSYILIKYFPTLGRAYGRWSGLEMWTGVSTHRNSLGQLCAIMAIFLFWSLLFMWKSRTLFNNKAQNFSDIFVLVLAFYLLGGPGAGQYSATSITMATLGVTILFVLSWKDKFARSLACHLKSVTVISVSIYLFIADLVLEFFANILNRDPSLTGRATDIWPVVIEAISRHPILGAGYGSVWGLGNEISAAVEVEQAHNGYLDVFLQLGAVGIFLLSIFILAFCGRVSRQINYSFAWGVFGIPLLINLLIYNNSESSFLEYTSILWTIIVYVTVIFSVPYSQRAMEYGRKGEKCTPKASQSASATTKELSPQASIGLHYASPGASYSAPIRFVD